MYTVLYAIGGYLLLLLALRALRRRPGAQMTPFEFVLIFLTGGIIILTTMDDDHSVTNSTMGVITSGSCIGWSRSFASASPAPAP